MKNKDGTHIHELFMALLESGILDERFVVVVNTEVPEELHLVEGGQLKK